MTHELATRPDNDIERMVKGWISYAAGAFPDDIPDDRLKRAATRLKVAILSVPKIDKCSGSSIGKCIALSAMTELYPGAGEMKPDVWLIPRDVKDKSGRVIRTDLNWQMGWRAYKRLAWRNGCKLTATLVYEGEPFKFYGGTEPRVEHEIDIVNEPTWARLLGGYVIATDPDGANEARWLTKEQIVQRRRVAQYDSVWKKWPLEMALKTLYAYAGGREMFIMDQVTARAIAADNQAETGGLELRAKLEPEQSPAATLAALRAGTQPTPEPEDEVQAEPVPAEDVSQEPARRSRYPGTWSSRAATSTPEPAALQGGTAGLDDALHLAESQEEPAGPRLLAMVKEKLLNRQEITDALRATKNPQFLGNTKQIEDLQDLPWAEVKPIVEELRGRRL